MNVRLTAYAPSGPGYGSFAKTLPPSFSNTTTGDTSCCDFPSCSDIATGDTSCDFLGCSDATMGDSSCGYPGCFDPTIVPDTQVFYPPKRLPIGSPSTVDTSRGEDGIYSHDLILDHDAEELWRFLLSNLNSPRLVLHVLATHTETRTRTMNHTDDEGNTSSWTEDYTETVTDCNFHVDVSNYVLPQWSRIVAQPSRDGSGTPTVRETLEEYTSSRNAFKEICLEKIVVWDYDRVTHLLTDLVRSMGHGIHVRVEFPKQEWKVSALASSRWSRAAHSTLVQVLCVLSCLCVVFWPLWAIARKHMKNRLTCEYQMAVSADEFITEIGVRFTRLCCGVVEGNSRLLCSPATGSLVSQWYTSHVQYHSN